MQRSVVFFFAGSLFCVFGVFSVPTHLPAQETPRGNPSARWKKPYDEWHLRVERYVPDADGNKTSAKLAETYNVRVNYVGQGTSLFYEADENAPFHLSGRCPVWSSISTGWIAKAMCVYSDGRDQIDWKMVRVAEAWFFEEPADGMPFELFFPHLPSRTITDRNTPGAKVEIRRSEKKGEVHMDVIIQMPGKDEVRITQVWENGATWWREYIRQVKGRKTLVARLERIVSTAEVEERLKKLKNRHLSWDDRLQVPITIIRGTAKASDVIAVVQRETGVLLEVDDELSELDPEMGDLHWRRIPAWAALTTVAESAYKKTEWEAFPPNGFRLKPSADWDPPAASKRFPRWGQNTTITAILSVALAAAGAFAIYRRRSNNAPTPV